MKKHIKGLTGLAICFLIYTTVYMGRQNLAIAAPVMEQEGIATKITIGIMGSMFFYIYAVGRLFSGWLGELLRPKPLLLGGFIAAAVCNMLIGFMPPIAAIFVLWGLNGLVQSSMWSSVMTVSANLFEEDRWRQIAIMVLAPTVGVGGILAVAVCTHAADLGARYVFLVPGIIMLIVSIPGLIMLPDIREQKVKGHLNLWGLLTHKNILRFIVPIMGQGIVKDNLNLWVPIFFMESYHIDIKAAAVYIFVMPIATLMGKFIFPVLFKLCKSNEVAAACICYAVSTLALIPLAAAALPIYAAAALMFVVSAFIGTANSTFSGMLPLRFFESGNIGSMSGVTDFLTYVGSATGSVVFGVLISKMGYSAMVWAWVGITLVSAVITMVFKKDYDRNPAEG